MTLGWMVRIGAAVAVRPALWGTAIVQGWRLRRRRWYRIAPFLPVPDPDYLRFRSVTAYGGDGSRPPEPADVITYLAWCRAWPHVAR
jgi:hypothetical protein